MIELASRKQPSFGTFTLCFVDKVSKAITKQIEAKNLVTFKGADIMAKSITGDPQYKITHAYLEHADPGGSGYIEGSLNGLVADRTDDISILRTSPRSTTDAEEAITSVAFVSTDSNKFLHNGVTFSSSFADSNLDGRIIVGAGLITIIGTIENLYAHSYFPAVIKPANQDIFLAWTQQFL